MKRSAIGVLAESSEVKEASSRSTGGRVNSSQKVYGTSSESNEGEKVQSLGEGTMVILNTRV
jgi:hypothetical protein